MVPLAGALCDAAENAIQLFMLLNGATDTLAALAFKISGAKDVALLVGLVLLAAALAARFAGRRKQAKIAL